MVHRNILPANPRPTHYELKITPDLSTFVFDGFVTIDLVADAPVSAVVLNYNDLSFISAVVKAADGTEQTVAGADIALDEVNQRATIPLAAALSGSFTVAIAYKGAINDKMCGFYRSKYTWRGESLFLGTTQMEAVDARRALPCWDEPVHKATFTLTLVIDSALDAVSNTAEESVKELEGGSKKEVKFHRTPKMSSYLFAWTIGHLDVIETTVAKVHSGEPTRIRVFATADKVEQGRFALDVAAKVLPLYERFFGSDYILPKVDLLAIPDFAAGAMENWGCITYRETALLCDASSSATHRHWVALVVAHELAHQWFGNLVTMSWWSELWLNESFATWVEYWAVDVLFPEWQIWTSFVHDDTGRALTLDALTSSHPVEVDVVNAQEIDEIFDAISYSKGGSVLRMAIEFIGMDAFQKGISAYLKHFAYGNATTADLWRFLGEAAGRDLTGILASWTDKIGYPVLTVDRPAEAGGSTLSVTQNRFLSTGPAAAEEDTTLWQIPLNVQVAGEPRPVTAIVEQRTGMITVPPGAAWVKVNANQGAFVRVKYSASMLEALRSAISAKAIGAIDRLSVVSDYHAFAQSGLVPTPQALEFLRAFTLEDDPIVWSAIAAFDSDVRSIIAPQGADAVAAFNKFIASVYTQQMRQLSLTPQASEDDRTAQLRATLLSRLAAAKDPETLAACQKLFADRTAAPIAADLRGAVYSAVVAAGGRAAFEEIKGMFEASSDAMECVRLLRALSAATEPALIDEALQFVLSDKVRSQDAMYVLIGLSSNTAAQDAFLTLVTTQFEQLEAKFPGMIIGRIYKAVENFASFDRADALCAAWETFDAQKRMVAERSFRQGVEGLRTRAAWAARDAADVVALVSKQE